MQYAQIKTTVDRSMDDSYSSRLSVLLCGLLLVISGCATVGDAARDAVSDAASGALQDRMESYIANYSDVLLYQFAYAQSFHVGGFGIGHEQFNEGEGTTWEVHAIGAEDGQSFTSERALLERNADGSSWWYLRTDLAEGESIEFEILHNPQMIAEEMYIRNPQTGEVRHHEFEGNPIAEQELDDVEESVEGSEYHTNFAHLEDYGEYTHSTEQLRVRAGTYNTDVLTYTDMDGDEEISYRWWISEDLPGFLVQFEMLDEQEQPLFRGEVVEHRQDYTRSMSR